MDRRRFLATTARAGSVALILPAGWLAGCGASSKDDPATTDPPTDGLRFTSDVAGIHTHDFLLAMDDLSTPVEVQGPTTVTLGHKHVVRLTQQDLTSIAAGATLNKATSIVDGHSHNFKFGLSTGQPLETTPATTTSPDGSSPSGT
ncbi:MAG TPA: hypothetical protein VHL80_04440 [Polyangia bacterium]|nr:hypothetical protein [Polyangia bacterium]